jgi:hypothetical protein
MKSQITVRIFECNNCKEPVVVSADWSVIQACPICAHSATGFKDLGTGRLLKPALRRMFNKED